MKKIGLFAAGVLFGTAGMKLLGSKDAKRAYAQTTAAALRAKDSVMTAVTAVREGRMTSMRRPRPLTPSARRPRPLMWWRIPPQKESQAE